MNFSCRNSEYFPSYRSRGEADFPEGIPTRRRTRGHRRTLALSEDTRPEEDKKSEDQSISSDILILYSISKSCLELIFI
jgi:hypothetical protein